MAATKDYFSRLPVEIKRQIVQEFIEARHLSDEGVETEPIQMHSLENFQGMVMHKVGPPKLAMYAALASDWKPLIEEHTFKTISFVSDTMEEARSVMDSDRRGHVRHVRLVFKLPEPFRSDRQSDQTSYLPRSKQRELNEVFTTFIQQSFDILSTSGFKDASVVLELVVEEFGAAWRTDCSQFEYLRAEEHNDGDLGIYLTLDNVFLPQLDCISTVETMGVRTRICIYPSSAVAIASRCPKVEGVHLYLYDYSFDTKHRIKMRNDLAASLDTLPDTLQRFTCNLSLMQRMGSGKQVANVTSPDPLNDVLSLAVYRVGLRPKLEAYAVMGSFELCVIGPESAADDSPIRPCLKSWSVQMLNQTPSGQFLRTGLKRSFVSNIMVITTADPGQAPEVDKSRYAPAPILRRTAVAAAKMPKLETMNYIGMVRVQYLPKSQTLMRLDQNPCYKFDEKTKKRWQTAVCAHSGPSATLRIEGDQGEPEEPTENGVPNMAATIAEMVAGISQGQGSGLPTPFGPPGNPYNVHILPPGSPDDLMKMLGIS